MDIADTALQIAADWQDALADFRDGRPANLAAMMRNHPIPENVAGALADAVESGRLPKRRNADKVKAGAATKRAIRQAWYFEQRFAESMRRDAVELGEAHGLEPADVLAIAKEHRAEALRVIADAHGVKPETARDTTKPKRTRGNKPR